jgi:hypothetical protein
MTWGKAYYILLMVLSVGSSIAILWMFFLWAISPKEDYERNLRQIRAECERPSVIREVAKPCPTTTLPEIYYEPVYYTDPGCNSALLQAEKDNTYLSDKLNECIKELAGEQAAVENLIINCR